jgi:hypothetical protein
MDKFAKDTYNDPETYIQEAKHKFGDYFMMKQMKCINSKGKQHNATVALRCNYEAANFKRDKTLEMTKRNIKMTK